MSRRYNPFANTPLVEDTFESMLINPAHEDSGDELDEIEKMQLALSKLKREADARQALRDHEQDLRERLRVEQERLGEWREWLSQDLARWRSAAPGPYYQFEEHLQNARVVAVSEVRRWDIVSWYQSGLPQYVKDTVEVVQLTHRTEMALRFQLHDFCGTPEEAEESSGKAYLEELYAYENFDSSDGYGYEAELIPGGPGHYKIRPGVSHRSWEEVKFIIRAFDTYLIRLQHAESRDRFPARPWRKSVDGMVHSWVREAVEALLSVPREDLTGKQKLVVTGFRGELAAWFRFLNGIKHRDLNRVRPGPRREGLVVAMDEAEVYEDE